MPFVIELYLLLMPFMITYAICNHINLMFNQTQGFAIEFH